MFAGRRDAPPEKKSARETVPYMNGFYDFSALGGEVCWGERRVEYDFDIIGDSPQQVEYMRAAVEGWLCNVHDAEILDDTMPEYHYVGSCDGVTVDDDETGLKVTLKASFVCQPFRVANHPAAARLRAGVNRVTNPGQSVIATVDCAGACVIELRGEAQSVSGAGVELLLPLRHGCNELTLTGDDATLRYFPEVI